MSSVIDVIADIKAFALSSSLLSALELGVFETIGSGAATSTSALAEHDGLDLAFTRGVVDVLTSNGYLDDQDGVLSLSEKGEIVREKQETLRPWAREMQLTY